MDCSHSNDLGSVMMQRNRCALKPWMRMRVDGGQCRSLEGRGAKKSSWDYNQNIPRRRVGDEAQALLYDRREWFDDESSDNGSIRAKRKGVPAKNSNLTQGVNCKGRNVLAKDLRSISEDESILVAHRQRKAQAISHLARLGDLKRANQNLKISNLSFVGLTGRAAAKSRLRNVRRHQRRPDHLTKGNASGARAQ